MTVEQKPDCRHHWLLGSPTGSEVHGRCKNCGDSTTFPAEPHMSGGRTIKHGDKSALNEGRGDGAGDVVHSGRRVIPDVPPDMRDPLESIRNRADPERSGSSGK